MKPLKYGLLLLAASGLLLTACHKDAKAKWTILAYYDGNNNIDEMANGTSAGIAEAQELEKIGSTDKVQVFAMIGAKKTGGGCKYYHVEKYENELPDKFSSTEIENLGSKDMSDKQVLHDFIVEGRKRYPAENYVLLLFDHGGGWRGLLYDEVNGAGAGMSLPTLREGLDTFHFNIIKFDMCLMSMIEVAYEVKDHADYMFGCQFVSRPHSFGSAEWLSALSANPNIASVDLGKKMVEAANNANIANQYTGHASLTDLTKLAPIVSQLGDLGTDLVAQGGAYGGEIIDALGNSHNTDLDGTYFIDLREFCKNVLQEPNLKNVNRIANECNAIVSGLNDAVVMTMTANTTIPRGGLCIHFPWRADMFDSADYVKLQFQATNWYSFLSKLIAALGGGGGGSDTCTVTGTANWPGHSLSNYANAYLDTIGGTTAYPIIYTPVSAGNGSFGFVFTINGDMQVLADVWDDANGDQTYGAGDGWGFYDPDQDGSWTANDAITIGPGRTLQGVNITLSPVTAGMHKPSVPGAALLHCQTNPKVHRLN